MKLTPETATDYLVQLARLAKGQPQDVIQRAILLRKLLDLLTRDLTSREALSFSDLNSRLTFICTRHPLPPELPDELHEVRKMGNRAAHSNSPLEEEKVHAAIVVMAKFVSVFSEVAYPEALRTHIETHRQTRMLPEQPVRFTEYLPVLKAVVLSVGQVSPSDRGGNYVQLRCRDVEGELGDIMVRVQDAPFPDGSLPPGQRFSDLAKWVWPYCTVKFFRLRKIAESDNRYATTYDTRMVLEPDYLLEPAELSATFFDTPAGQVANPWMMLASRLLGMDTASYLLAGTIANDLLDQLIRNPDLDMQEAIRNALRLRYLSSVRLGAEVLKQIRAEIQEKHFPNLVQFAHKLRDQQTLIEPTFITADYGLLGRLDVMLQHPTPDEQDIYELKSGKAPLFGSVNASHQMQVVCYNLLLESVSKGKRKGVSAVFYSKTDETPLRNVNPVVQQIQYLLYIRNQLVAAFHELETDSEGLWKRMLSATGTLPRYKEMDFVRIQQTFEHLDPESAAYFHTFLEFVQREIRTAKVGDSVEDDLSSDGFAALWRLSRQEKLDAYNLLGGLSFRQLRPDGHLEFTRPEGQSLVTNFREGDICLIYPDDGDHLDPLGYQILKCRLVKLEPDKLLIRFNNPQADQGMFYGGKKWVLEHDFQEKNYHVLQESLYEFAETNAQGRQKLLGLKPPVFEELPDPARADALLPPEWVTPKQKQVILQAVRAKDFFLIQGPPGTGKTSAVLTRIVQLRYELRKESMVVLAFTNRAVAEIEKRLATTGIPFLRLGAQGTETSLETQFASKNFNEVTAAILSTPVYVATVASFLNSRKDLFAIRKFDTLIVDEASQLLEPQLSGLFSRFNCTILIGDQNQLPAVSVQRDQTCLLPEDHVLRGIGFEDLRTSFFERFWKRNKAMALRYPGSSWEKATDMLEDHFRMHRDIAALINPWYGGKLRHHLPEQESDFAPMTGDFARLEQLIHTQRLIFIPSEKGEEDKCHPKEAELVARLLEWIRKRYGADFQPEEHVGVVTPWRAQIGLIKAQLAGDPDFDKVTVDTVERFQGSERDVIIVSLAVNKARQLTTLTSETLTESGEAVDRKLNVTLSRARQQVILLGNPEILKGSVHYQRVMDAMVHAI